jgi:hypothetical protein
LNGADGKDWGDLGKINFSKEFFSNQSSLDGMFKQMGGGGGAGLGGASVPDLNDLDDEETDSDDEPMPDLEDVPKTDDEKAKLNPTNEETK